MPEPTQEQIIEALKLGKAACLVACALEPIQSNWKKWENAADIIERQIAALTPDKRRNENDISGNT
jgi:hypothetical protein